MTTRALSKRLALTTMAALTIFASLALTGPVGEAEAAARSSQAAIGCEAGRVRLHRPTDRGIVSNRYGAVVMVASLLYRWNGQSWVDAGNTGWWAYTVTDREGRPGMTMPNSRWQTVAGNNMANFKPMAVRPGYYAAISVVYDASDGTFSSFLHRTDVSNPNSSHWCQVR